MTANINLTDEQKHAVSICTDLTTRIACVTGQAGTGKTTILKNAYDEIMEKLCAEHGMDVEDYDYDNLEEMPFSIRLCAPTGRAAKRIEEATGIPAMTIHRMLRFSVPAEDDDFGMPAYTKQNPMPYHVIFVDEASMLDDTIRRAVIDAMRKGACIRFFGDINQLPPIAGPSPFAVDLKRFPSATLTENFRSTDGIISLANRVIHNKMPIANEQVKLEKVKNSDMSYKLLQLCKERDYTKDENQIIAPTNATKYGTNNINLFIQQKFNPNKEKIKVYRRDPATGSIQAKAFKRNDKILWTKNDYDIGLMNGTIGRVLDFHEGSGEIIINCDGQDYVIPSTATAYNPVTRERYQYDPRQRLDLGYAVSTHKAQGSQFDNVTYIISNSRAATRQNVYTAVTRAKYYLHIVSVGPAFHNALMKNAAPEAS